MKLPSHATIAAYAALFVAVSTGGAYAATVLPKNSVSSRQIKDRSVRMADLNPSARPPSRARLSAAITEVVTDPATGLNITVHGEKGDPGEAGPQGAAGPQGQAGVARRSTADAYGPDSAPPSESGAVANCPPGQKVLGGGGRFEAQGQAGAVVVESLPEGDSGWRVVMHNGGPATGRVHAFAVCAEASE